MSPSAVSETRLLRSYELYDQAVDVVCAFEFLFTVPTDMQATVAHFERFPKIPVVDKETGKTETLTPDFTVLFTDNTALVGEVSRLSLQPKSVEKACAQILRYDGLTHVPGPNGQPRRVTDLDVLQLVPLDIGPDAVDRIISERFKDPDHPYKPRRPPCIIQFARDSQRYMFQRINDPDNGVLHGHGREPHMGARIKKINVLADHFTTIKSARKFMNDPVDPLYLAVVLYTQTWPTHFGTGRRTLTVDPVATAQTLRRQYGTGTAEEVRHALALLVSAGLAADNQDGTWAVHPKPPRARGEQDLARLIAARSATQARPLVHANRTKQPPTHQQDTLF